MIPAYGQRLMAKFAWKGGTKVGRRQVVAWADDGAALVVDVRAGRLVPAADDPTFLGLAYVARPKDDDQAEGGEGK